MDRIADFGDAGRAGAGAGEPAAGSAAGAAGAAGASGASGTDAVENAGAVADGNVDGAADGNVDGGMDGAADGIADGNLDGAGGDGVDGSGMGVYDDGMSAAGAIGVDMESQMETVEGILASIGAFGGADSDSGSDPGFGGARAADKKMLIAFNKVDKIRDKAVARERMGLAASICGGRGGAGTRDAGETRASGGERGAFGAGYCEISAATGEGVDTLLAMLSEMIDDGNIRLDVSIPYEDGSLNAFLHENANVLSREYTDAGVRLSLSLNRAYAGRLKKYVV
jgi:hypothetical protein